MTKKHIVEQGECMASIAALHGFKNWRLIYDDPANQALRERRPNPNLLFPRDEVVIPDKETKLETADTGARHTFFVRPPVLRRLRLIVRDHLGAPIKNTNYNLQLDTATTPMAGVTDSRGALLETIPASAKEATLTVGNLVWKLAIAALNPIAKTLDKGVSGAQGRLSNLGYDPGKIDGIVGPKTTAAVKRFQKDQKMDPTGALDSATLAALEKAHGS